MAHHHIRLYSAINVGSPTIINQEKVNNEKHSKTKLPLFSRLLRHSAMKWGGLIVQCYQAHKRLTVIPLLLPPITTLLATNNRMTYYC